MKLPLFLLAVILGGFIAHLRNTSPVTPELAAIVNEVCPFGGKPMPQETLGIMFASAVVKDLSVLDQAQFCISFMWRS